MVLDSFCYDFHWMDQNDGPRAAPLCPINMIFGPRFGWSSSRMVNQRPPKTTKNTRHAAKTRQIIPKPLNQHLLSHHRRTSDRVDLPSGYGGTESSVMLAPALTAMSRAIARDCGRPTTNGPDDRVPDATFGQCAHDDESPLLRFLFFLLDTSFHRLCLLFLHFS